MAAPSYLWLLHQPASVAWLKRELQTKRPDLHLAFSRPGLTTFKVEPGHEDEPVHSAFARAWGQSLGRATNREEVLALAARVGPMPLRLHVFERDLDRPADEGDPLVVGSRARALAAELCAASSQFLDGDEAHVGDRVLDVIAAPAELPEEPLFVGTHTHDATRGALPGGVPHVAIPSEAPSRAWAKIEEAIRWSGLVPRSGDTAIELGSSPGGASYALLERGLEVHGVDPGAMAPNVLAYRGARGNHFVHPSTPAAEVQRGELPRRFEWLLSDMNLAPMVALKYIERFVALAHGELRGAFLTLKINDDGIFEALPVLMERIAKLGAREVRYTQLPSHRSEVVAVLRY